MPATLGMRHVNGKDASRVMLREVKCVACDARQSTRLCDFDLDGGRTCAAPLCRVCSWSPKPAVDYCPPHAKAIQEAKR